MTYAHDAHCNVIHEPGPQECPPHCDDERHISGEPCPSCGSTVLVSGGRQPLLIPVLVDPTAVFPA